MVKKFVRSYATGNLESDNVHITVFQSFALLPKKTDDGKSIWLKPYYYERVGVYIGRFDCLGYIYKNYENDPGINTAGNVYYFKEGI